MLADLEIYGGVSPFMPRRARDLEDLLSRATTNKTLSATLFFQPFPPGTQTAKLQTSSFELFAPKIRAQSISNRENFCNVQALNAIIRAFFSSISVRN
ncbi:MULTISPECIES: hypothetical protein [Methylomonas]|uniref:Uncharacterized protein n=1 Tax=Methylomonas denitrificans TaxID=1538553 RepID=A0A126T2I0_9GAMM|nr:MULTISPECIES: hypothetical protein [Methylomonas]AMK76296.1 hypothetical protein JT25_007280 [Methylomonas denitrificans]OAI00735.1 hypothetical protein A1342_17685 [Methylomonas methanica]